MKDFVIENSSAFALAKNIIVSATDGAMVHVLAHLLGHSTSFVCMLADSPETFDRSLLVLTSPHGVTRAQLEEHLGRPLFDYVYCHAENLARVAQSARLAHLADGHPEAFVVWACRNLGATLLAIPVGLRIEMRQRYGLPDRERPPIGPDPLSTVLDRLSYVAGHGIECGMPGNKDVRTARAWIRKNTPAGTAVLFVHPLEEDPTSLDMLTVYGGGLSEERLLAGDYDREGEDTRAAAAVYNARALMVQLFTGGLDAPIFGGAPEELGLGGIPLSELAPESRAAEKLRKPS